MKERILAVGAVVLLIAGALVARDAIAGDDTGGGKTASSGKPVVACTQDLIEVCDALADAGEIAADPPVLDLDQAADPPDDIDSWITWDPAPRIANFDAEGTWSSPTVLGTAPLSVVAADGALAAGCPDETTWACLARSAEAGLAIGVGRPSTAEGIARLAPLARALTDADDPDALDVLALADLVAGPSGGQRDAAHQADALVVTPGALDAVVGPAPVLTRAAGTPRGQGRELDVREPAPEASAGVVLVSRPDHRHDLPDLCEPPDEPSLLRLAAGVALVDAGIEDACVGDLATDQVAGFLYRVRQDLE